MAKKMAGGPKTSLEVQLRDRMTELRCSQSMLAQGVADLLGEEPMTQTAVIKWLRRPENLVPARMFAIEAVLQVPPGTYSRQIGYLPLSARSAAQTVEAAIASDPDLTDVLRAALIGSYQAMKAELRKARRRSSDGKPA